MEHNSSEDEDDRTFLSQIRRNPLLEREEAYKKLNQELEKKTSDLMSRFEKYSESRSLSSRSLCGGDEARSMFELGMGDGINAHGDKFSAYQRNLAKEPEHGGLKHSLSSSSLLDKMALLSTIPRVEEEAGEKEKKPSRLQRATESVIRSLHSKLQNHEERLADLHLQYRHKIQENTILESKIKALEDERERLLKTISSLQTIVDKYAKDAELSKNNLSSKTQSVNLMKKEIYDIKRESKLTNAASQTLQSRLNRCLEENTRLKNQAKSTNIHLRELESGFKSKFDEQRHKILELEKQKISLNSTIKKQANMMKILREQKVRTVGNE